MSLMSWFFKITFPTHSQHPSLSYYGLPVDTQDLMVPGSHHHINTHVMCVCVCNCILGPSIMDILGSWNWMIRVFSALQYLTWHKLRWSIFYPFTSWSQNGHHKCKMGSTVKGLETIRDLGVSYRTHGPCKYTGELISPSLRQQKDLHFYWLLFCK